MRDFIAKALGKICLGVGDSYSNPQSGG